MTDESVFGAANRVFLEILRPYLGGLHGLEDLPEGQPSLHELLRGAGLGEPTVEEMRTMKAALQLFGFDPSGLDRAYGEDRTDSQLAETGEEGIPSLAALRATQRARRRNCRRVVLALAATVVLAVAYWRRRGH